MVIFTTAYDRYALEAFDVNSIDYLLKPIDPERLDRALDKLERLAARPRPDIKALAKELAVQLAPNRRLERIASKVGERTTVLDVARISHFSAKDKLTFAVVGGREHVIDYTLSELEDRLDPAAVRARPSGNDCEPGVRPGTLSGRRRRGPRAAEGRAKNRAERSARPRKRAERPARNLKAFRIPASGKPSRHSRWQPFSGRFDYHVARSGEGRRRFCARDPDRPVPASPGSLGSPPPSDMGSRPCRDR